MVAKFRALLIVLVGIAMATAGMTSANAANPIEPYPYFLWKIDATAANITVAWWPISGAKSYGVCVTPTYKSTFVKTCANGSWTRVYPNSDNPNSPNNNPNYNFGTVGGLERGTSYRIQVRAYGDTASTYSKRLTDYSPQRTYSTDSVASSSPPADFAVTGVRGGVFKATWSQIGNSNYEVRFAKDANPDRPSGAASCSPASCVRTSVRSADVTGLVQGGTYRVAVRAIDSKSESGINPIPRSPWTSIRSVTLPNLNAFQMAPPNWTGAHTGPSDGFTVDWDAPAGFSSASQRFLVFVSDQSGITSGRTNAWLTTTGSLHVRSGEGTAAFGGGWTNLVPTTTYSINVAVVPAGFNLSQAQNNANYVDAQLLSDYPPQQRFSLSGVGPIETSSAKVGGVNRLKLTWDEVPGAGAGPYKLYVDGNGVDSGSDSICVTDDVLGDGKVSAVLDGSYRLEGGSSSPLDPLTTYYVNVAWANANCEAGIGAWRDAWVPVKTPNWYDLDAPSPFRLVASGASAIKFEWDQDTKGMNPRYRIEYRKSGSWLAKTTAANATDVTVTNLDSATYHWRVRAVASDGTTPLSPWSVELTVKPSNGNGTISGQVANPNTAGTSTLGAFAYFQWGTNAGDLAGGVRVGVDGRYTISGLVPNTYYRVRLEQLDRSSNYVSPWVNPGGNIGLRTRDEVPSSYYIATCAESAEVCPTVTATTTEVLQGVRVSGNLPTGYGVVDMTALYPQTNGVWAGNDRVNTATSTTYSIGGLWPAAMGGGSYKIQLSVGGTVKATRTTGHIGSQSNYTVNFQNVVPPATPTALTSSNVGPTTATISWHGPADATGYRLYYGPNADGSAATKVEGGSTPSMNLTGLTPGSRYYVSVATLRGSEPEVSDYTSRISITTPNGLTPGMPTNFTATATGATTATLTWNAGSNATGYRLWYGLMADGTGGATMKEVGSVTSTNLTGLSPNTTYYTNIASLRGSERSGYTSPRASFTTSGSGGGGGGTLDRPTNLHVSGSPAGKLSFAWDSSAYGHRLYWGTRNDGRGLTGPVNGIGSTFTTPNLSNGCYYITLAARNESNETGPWTLGNEVAAAYPQPSSFGTPKCINADKKTAGQLSVSWNVVPDADYYRIYYGYGSRAPFGGGLTRYDVNNGTTGHVVITGLVPNRKYYVKIAAKKSDDTWSGWTANGEATATP